MCTVCGCGVGETRIEGKEVEAHHHHDHEHDDGCAHHHQGLGHDHGDGAYHHQYGLGPARTHAPGLSQGRMVRIEQDILAKNDVYAARNRAFFEARGILALNLVSSPGSGKTTLLVRTIEDLRNELDLTVIEGDQQTSNDAERIRTTGARAIQINTGKGCHLDAHMVGHALDSVRPADGSLVLIENVGNLVCPAAFDLGEAHKVVILSVAEGEDKPIKYPDMFHATDLMLLSKVDLLPHLDFDVGKCLAYARRVNPRIGMLQISARDGAGLAAWYAWLKAACQCARAGRPGLTAAG